MPESLTEENLRYHYIERNVGLKDMPELFDVSLKKIRTTLKEYEILKPAKAAAANSHATLRERYGDDFYRLRSVKAQEAITPEARARGGATKSANAKKRYAAEGIAQETLHQAYIVENLSLIATGERFGRNKNQIRKILTFFGIKKTPELVREAQLAGHALAYEDEEKVKERVIKTQATIRERYGENWYYNHASKGELELLATVKDLLPGEEVESGRYNYIRRPGSGGAMQLDIVIPRLKIAVEFNGVYYHDRDAYLKDLVDGTELSREALKDRLCSEIGFTLIHVWSDEWKKDRISVMADLKKVVAERLAHYA